MPAAVTRVAYRGLGYIFYKPLTYRKAWKQFEAAFARLPTDRALIRGAMQDGFMVLSVESPPNGSDHH